MAKPPSKDSGKKPFMVMTRRAMAGWVVVVFIISAWMFGVGVMVGRGTAPVQFDLDQLKKQVESLSKAKSETRPGGTQEKPAQMKEKTGLDFYEILPQFEVEVPEADASSAPRVRAHTVEEPGSYLLQAGSFGAAADADRLQASLALRGIESHVQRVTIDGAVFHRVRIGPISDLEALNRTRRQLRNAGIDALLMKAPK